MEDPIIKLVRTKSEQRELIDLIDNLKDNNFVIKPSSVGDKSLIEKALITALASIEIKNKKAIETFLDSLRDRTIKLEILKLTIPFNPNEKTIAKLNKWAQDNLPANTIYDINVDPDILGGAIIISNKGNYSDISLSKKIGDLFVTKKKEIFSQLLPNDSTPKPTQA